MVYHPLGTVLLVQDAAVEQCREDVLYNRNTDGIASLFVKLCVAVHG